MRVTRSVVLRSPVACANAQADMRHNNINDWNCLGLNINCPALDEQGESMYEYAACYVTVPPNGAMRARPGSLSLNGARLEAAAHEPLFGRIASQLQSSPEVLGSDTVAPA